MKVYRSTVFYFILSLFTGIIFSFLIFLPTCKAQQGEWTWMRGDSTFNSAGHYGEIGVTDSANYPPARYSPTSWTDPDGNFWIYGGYGTSEFLGDMWRYNVNTNKWTWVFGTKTPNLPASYGVMGIPSINNFPGCRGWGGASWVDADGDLWMFGGKGYGLNPNAPNMLADLWRYNILSNKWTWMKGNPEDTSHYGLFGVPDSTKTPGSRMEVTANWTDSTGLWFYGGTRDNHLKNDGNDMWRFDISTNSWEWMSGDTIANVLPNPGTQYVFAFTNTPGGRFAHCAWQDALGKFWMFGGHNDLIGDDWADLWQYDPAINQWAWQSGSIDSTLGVSGALCDTSHNFYPKGRWENRLAWIDDCDNLWLFGGQRTINSLNDLWVYSTVKKIWSFAGGTLFTNNDGNYGKQGIPDVVNLPPSRMGAGAWQDEDGNFWLFGGSRTTAANQFYSDLWKFKPDSLCPAGIECGIPTSIIETTEKDNPVVMVYPNPSQGIFMIEIPHVISENEAVIEIFNTLGNLVYSSSEIISSVDWRKEINLDAAVRGIYFIKIKTGKLNVTAKIFLTL
ncbi:MAG: kelch repeat-containing protein [Chitinophagales bacterium]